MLHISALKKGVLRRLRFGQCGLTLVETAVALAILSLGVGLVGSGVFQVLSIQRFWQDDRVATKDNRHAASWFAGDALRASDALRADSSSLPPGESVSDRITLVLEAGNVTYYLDGDEVVGYSLVRQSGGGSNVVATQVEGVEFSRSSGDGKVLTFVLKVKAARGAIEKLTLENYLRMAP